MVTMQCSIQNLTQKFEEVLSCLKEIRQNQISAIPATTLQIQDLTIVPEAIVDTTALNEFESMLGNCDRNPNHELTDKRTKLVSY